MNENKHLPLTETVYYVLLSLLHPAHGYIIMKNIEDLSGGRVKMAPGTLYGAIENLLKHQLIEPYPSEDRRRKTYIITELGRNVLWKDMERMERLVDITRQEVNKRGDHMKKYRYFMDIDREEQWLNKMADKGCELKGKFFYPIVFQMKHRLTILPSK